MGFVMIFKSSSVLNFAHGELLAIGAYFFLALATWAKLPIPLVFLLALGGCFVLGLLIERIFLRPLIGEPLIFVIMLTVGLAAMFKGLILLIWGGNLYTYPDFLPKSLGNPLGDDPDPARLWGGPHHRNALSGPLRPLLQILLAGDLHAFRCRQPAGRPFSRGECEARLCLSWAIAALVAGMSGIVLGIINGVNVHDLSASDSRSFPSSSSAGSTASAAPSSAGSSSDFWKPSPAGTSRRRCATSCHTSSWCSFCWSSRTDSSAWRRLNGFKDMRKIHLHPCGNFREAIPGGAGRLSKPTSGGSGPRIGLIVLLRSCRGLRTPYMLYVCQHDRDIGHRRYRAQHPHRLHGTDLPRPRRLLRRRRIRSGHSRDRTSTCPLSLSVPLAGLVTAVNRDDLRNPLGPAERALPDHRHACRASSSSNMS